MRAVSQRQDKMCLRERQSSLQELRQRHARMLSTIGVHEPWRPSSTTSAGSAEIARVSSQREAHCRGQHRRAAQSVRVIRVPPRLSKYRKVRCFIFVTVCSWFSFWRLYVFSLPDFTVGLLVFSLFCSYRPGVMVACQWRVVCVSTRSGFSRDRHATLLGSHFASRSRSCAAPFFSRVGPQRAEISPNRCPLCRARFRRSRSRSPTTPRFFFKRNRRRL